MKRVGAVAVAKAAASRPALELLALDENEISENGLDEVGVVRSGLVPQVVVWACGCMPSGRCWLVHSAHHVMLHGSSAGHGSVPNHQDRPGLRVAMQP